MDELYEAGPDDDGLEFDPGGEMAADGQDLLDVAGALQPDVPEDQQHAMMALMAPAPPAMLQPQQQMMPPPPPPALRMDSTQSGLLLRHASQSSLDESSQKIGTKVS